MKKNIILLKEIKNHKDGHHLNSKFWQEWKKNVPSIPTILWEISIGMVLSDGSISKKSNNAVIKFEQGYNQKDFLYHLFDIYKDYCFMTNPGERLELRGDRKGLIKSFWFKTFSHQSFTDIFNLFYVNENGKNIKKVQKGLVKDKLTSLGLAYWIMGDGSLQNDKKTMILHTQSFTYDENLVLSNELNEKFGFSSEVILHKKIYWVIKIPSSDALLLYSLIKDFIHSSMKYKLPTI